MNDEDLEILIKKTKDRATEIFAKTENCAYSPFIALMEAINVPLNDEINAIPIGFAGGISGSGHICGALWASIATISIYQKKLVDKNNENKNEPFILRYISVHNKSSEAYKNFVSTFGSPNCKDLNQKFDLISEEQRKKCTYIVRKTIEITLREIFEKERDKNGKQ
ncbi:MAG: C-GCAxxG-C-C family (seleno)protein [Thermoplasmata archaeon]|jgi:C_GCAxxG_C_C family probable redox protein